MSNSSINNSIHPVIPLSYRTSDTTYSIHDSQPITHRDQGFPRLNSYTPPAPAFSPHPSHHTHHSSPASYTHHSSPSHLPIPPYSSSSTASGGKIVPYAPFPSAFPLGTIDVPYAKSPPTTASANPLLPSSTPRISSICRALVGI